LKTFFAIGLVLLSNFLFAQREDLHAHYTYNLMAVNPAYAGLENQLSVTLLHRSQWAVFPGAPRLQTASVHAPFGRNVGLGFSFAREQIGPEQNIAIKGDYSFTIRSEEKVKIVFGLKAALNMLYINLIDLELDDPDDPSFLNNKQSILLPNFGVGIIAYTKDYYFGFSIPDLIVHNYLNNTIYSSSHLWISSKHYYFIGGAALPLSHKLLLKPSGYFRFSRSTQENKFIEIEAEIGIMAEYNSSFHGGFSVRTENKVAAFLGLKIVPDLDLGYSFDLFYFNKLQKYNGGSHEIVLKYDLYIKQRKRPIPCPTFQLQYH
jgi:type IX secretion system PorP/SprF family membrane protein